MEGWPSGRGKKRIRPLGGSQHPFLCIPGAGSWLCGFSLAVRSASHPAWSKLSIAGFINPHPLRTPAHTQTEERVSGELRLQPSTPQEPFQPET